MQYWLLTACLVMVRGDTELDGEILLNIQHSFDLGQSWEERGSVNIHSTRSGAASVEQTGLQMNQKLRLQEMCGSGTVYLIRITGVDHQLHRSFTSACSLLESNLQDLLTISLDWRGKVMAVSLAAQQEVGRGGRNSFKGIQLDTDNSLNFRTKVVTQMMENGPVPDTAAFIQRMEEDKRKAEKGEVKDNRSFLAKYWMYIIPVVLFMAVNGAAGPEGGAGAAR